MLHRARMRLASLLGAAAVAVLAAVPLAGTATAAPALAASHGTSTQATATQRKTQGNATQGKLWSTQLDFDDNGTPWSVASLAALKADGLNSVEIDMSWNAVEP